MATADSGQHNIAARCKASGGLVETSLGELREELGYRKLGRYVLEEIAGNLASANLGYFPLSTLNPEENDEPRQWHTVWIYQRDGGRRAQVIDAVLNPAGSDVRAALDGLVDGQSRALTDKQKLEEIHRIITGA